MSCMCQYEYTNIVPSNGTKIVRLGYLFTYVDEVLDMQGEAESSIFSISYAIFGRHALHACALRWRA